jgi:hypothetical protein
MNDRQTRITILFSFRNVSRWGYFHAL